MRLGLPLMLMVSLALHGGVAAGFFLSYSGATATTPAVKPEVKSSTLVLIGTEDTPAPPQSSPAASAPAANPVAVTEPPALPVPAPDVPANSLPVPQPPTVALEANPNADLQALPPEAILSPSPAPHLNGHDAVVFILDVSGSMYEPYAGSTRLAFARETLCRRISALKNGAPFAVTLYAERARNSGPLVAASAATREAARRFVMEDVDCGGGTNLPEGLASARQLDPGRLVVVTDGDLNMNLPELLTKSRAILGPAGHGPALTVIGIDPRARSGDEEVLKSIADQQSGAYLREHVASSAELLTANRNQSATTGTP